MNNIESCGADAVCRADKRVDTSAAFFLSIEYQTTGFFALRVQRVAFGSRSNSAGARLPYRQLIAATRRLGEGVIVGQPGAEQRLEQNRQAYAEEIVTRSLTFRTLHPPELSASEYVDSLYATAGVTPTAAERQAAIEAFGAGGNAGRVAAFRKVVESQSVASAELNAAFVLLQYDGYLRRNPTDPPDANDDGYQFWLRKLNEFGGDFRRAEMVKAFIVSGEYRARFGR
jgi:hypothetical protein